MKAAIPFRSLPLFTGESAGTTFRAIFEHAPMAVARCSQQGVVAEMNPAFERCDRRFAEMRVLKLSDLVSPQDRDETDSLLRDLFESRCESISFEGRHSEVGKPLTRWCAWRESDHVLLIAEQLGDQVPADESLIQTQRWEAVGRMTGGVVHDFNNLLTGVMLYCDLLLSTLDSRDNRRRYADEIRSAISQAAGLVQRLLVFARPQALPVRDLSLNEVARGMLNLLARLIGENIALDLHLDAQLGLVHIDQAQAQQILLNLVLNARDALPDGGQITIETSNCGLQAPVAATTKEPIAQIRPAAFPCVLLSVRDNGHGMSAETRQRIFEPFFTTKNAGQGTGLGLTTVRSIVTTSRGLIHFESELGHGTRVLVLLPRAFQSSEPDSTGALPPDSDSPSTIQGQKIEKESHL